MKGAFYLTALAIIGNVQSLDLKDVAEIYSCEKLTVDKNLTDAWTASVPIWYVPFWNGIEYYENALDFFGPEKFAAMKVNDLEKSCVTYRENGTSTPVYGFGGRQIEYQVFPDPVRKGIAYWTLPDSTGEKVYRTTSYVTKTDNKSYLVVVTVWEDDYKGFYVSSLTPTLDPSVFAEIKDHVLGLGFNPKYFIEYNYDGCPPSPKYIKEIVKANQIKISVIKN